MRFEDVAPRTLLLGALAAWAMGSWWLSLAGMGARVPGPESGVMAAPPLPPMPRGPAPTLGPAAQYAGISARPLFAVDRRPHPFTLQNDSAAPVEAPSFDLVLTSVLITPQAKLAIVQKPDGSEAWRVRVGDTPEAFPGWRLSSLQPRSATFIGPEGERTLQLRVFDGQGGSAPTPVAGINEPPVEQPGRVPTVPAPTVAGPSVPVPVPNAPVASSAAPPPPAPPPTDASAPDPAQIEAIRRRIEARREQMRQRAQNTNPPATVAPPPLPTR